MNTFINQLTYQGKIHGNIFHLVLNKWQREKISDLKQIHKLQCSMLMVSLIFCLFIWITWNLQEHSMIKRFSDFHYRYWFTESLRRICFISPHSPQCHQHHNVRTLLCHYIVYLVSLPSSVNSIRVLLSIQTRRTSFNIFVRLVMGRGWVANCFSNFVCWDPIPNNDDEAVWKTK